MAFNDAGHELNLYQELATAVGETLEAVCNMQEQEREELITVLGLRTHGSIKLVKVVEEKSAAPVVANTGPIIIKDDDTTDDDDMMEIVDLVLGMEKDQENITKDDDSPEVKDIKEVESEAVNNDSNNNEKQVATIVVDPLDIPSDEVNPKLISLQQDTETVLRLLGPDRGPAVNGELVLAYLEAHIDKVDRVQVVMEELAGMDNDPQTPERQPSLEITRSEKGKGKSSKLLNSFDLENRLAVVRKRSLGIPFTLDTAGTPKKQRLAENLLEQPSFHRTVPILASSAGPSSASPPQPAPVTPSQPSTQHKPVPSEVPAPSTPGPINPTMPLVINEDNEY